MIKQKQAVVDAVANVLGEDFIPSTTIVKDVITTDQKNLVKEEVLGGILNGSVSFGGSLEDEKAVAKYVSSMIDNHFRKALELNGNVPYKPARTGTKRDPQLREMNKLLLRFPEDSQEHAEIAAEIALRNEQLAEMRAAKRNATSIGTIDTEVLPEHLRALAGVSIPTENETSASTDDSDFADGSEYAE